jgi:hypothetical protein
MAATGDNPAACIICEATEDLWTDDLGRHFCRNSKRCVRRWRTLRAEAIRAEALKATK